MELANNNVAVIGATGVVGSGIVRKYLEAGATVVGVSRRRENLAKLRAELPPGSRESMVDVVGDFCDEAAAEEAGRAVARALGGDTPDHVVSAQGFVEFSEAPSGTSFSTLSSALQNGLYNNFLAAKTFLPALKDREGSSFTLVSGGLAHQPPPDPAVWLGTLKNAALNALGYALSAETANDKVRVNTLCIHFSVALAGHDKNQIGLESDGDTVRLAPAFLAIAAGRRKGELLCLHDWADVDKVAGES